jgi:hypothetical protein
MYDSGSVFLGGKMYVRNILPQMDVAAFYFTAHLFTALLFWVRFFWLLFWRPLFLRWISF